MEILTEREISRCCQKNRKLCRKRSSNSLQFKSDGKFLPTKRKQRKYSAKQNSFVYQQTTLCVSIWNFGTVSNLTNSQP